MWRSSACEPVGNYAVKLVFDDMHDSGIYGWDYLYRLGAEQGERWQAYLDELAAKGCRGSGCGNDCPALSFRGRAAEPGIHDR